MTTRPERSPWWTEIDWPGACAFVLALGVALGLVLGFINALVEHEPLSAEASNLLSTLGGAAIGAVATYLGITHAHAKRDDDKEPDDRRSAD